MEFKTYSFLFYYLAALLLIFGVSFFVYQLISPEPTNQQLTPNQFPSYNFPKSEPRLDHDRNFIIQTCEQREPLLAIANTLDLKTILERVGLVDPLNRMGVNIGAGTGLAEFRFDPTYDAFGPMKYEGLLVDGEGPNLFPLETVLNPNNDHNLVFEVSIVTPLSIHDLVFKNPKISIPYDLDLFKLDIDCYDYDLFEKFLSFAKPKVVIAEINPLFKPPFMFKQHYHPESTTVRDPNYYGSSLSAMYELGIKNGYTLIQLEYWDIILVQDKYAHLFEPKDRNKLWYDNYLNTPLLELIRNHRCPHLEAVANLYYPDMERWIDGTTDEILFDMYKTLLARPSMNREAINWTLSIESEQTCTCDN